MTSSGVELLPSVELLAAHIGRYVEEPTFIQVGAYDGEANDPLVNVAVQFGWRGVLIEPQPRAFAKLVQLHGSRPNFLLKRAAVAASADPRMLYSLRSEPGLPDWAYQISSFDRSHVLKSQRHLPAFNIQELLVEELVPCVTFDMILEESKLSRVDVLQVDTEGFDYEILKLFNVGLRLPSVVAFEHLHLSTPDWNASTQLLIDAGYKVAKAGYDTIALREASLKAC